MHTPSPLNVIILAAGQGTRMRSHLPKVLHPLGGQPLLAHVLERAQRLHPAQIIVVHGHGAEAVRAYFADRSGPDHTQSNGVVQWVLQAEQRGTAHAVAQAMPLIRDGERVVVLYGDVPLVSPESLSLLVEGLQRHALVLQSMHLAQPGGYGRIVRDAQGRPCRIVEDKDASPEERAITEVNTGFMAARSEALRDWLARIDCANAQGEYYLTDCLALAVADQANPAALVATHSEQFLGVNDRLQLAQLERIYQHQQAARLMRAGVSLRDPARLDVRGQVLTGQDVCIDVNVVLEGTVRLGDGVVIGPGCVIKDSELEPGVEIRAHSVIEGAHIGAHSIIGPFARLRPGTTTAAQVHIGNFVEVKNTLLGEGSKANHLSYLGDAEIGSAVNIGAGTITCNYDGAFKHRTVIQDGAFIGSGTQLIAPVCIGTQATIGAGSTITRDAPDHSLSLSRTRQHSYPNWQRPKKPPA